jgi:hypothetical protein
VISFTMPDAASSDAIGKLLPEGYDVDARRYASGKISVQRSAMPLHSGDAGAESAVQGAGRRASRHL